MQRCCNRSVERQKIMYAVDSDRDGKSDKNEGGSEGNVKVSTKCVETLNWNILVLTPL